MQMSISSVLLNERIVVLEWVPLRFTKTVLRAITVCSEKLRRLVLFSEIKINGQIDTEDNFIGLKKLFGSLRQGDIILK